MKHSILALLLLFSASLFANDYQGTHVVKLKDGMSGFPVSASIYITAGTNVVYTVPATGTFYLTGFYSNNAGPSHAPTDLFDYSIGAGPQLGYVFTSNQVIDTPIFIPAGTQLQCQNPDGSNLGTYCSITGLYNLK